MNKNIEQILSICAGKSISDYNKREIFQIIKEELVNEHVSKNEILEIKRIFNEKEFNSFYIDNYPEYFIDTKDGLIENLATVPKSAIMEKLPLLENYKDEITYDDFIKIVKLNVEDKSQDDFSSFCWNTLFKEEFIYTEKFIDSLDSYHYRWGCASSSITNLILKHMNSENNVFSKPCLYEEKETLPFHDCFIIYQIFSSVYGESNCKKNMDNIKEYYKENPEKFNHFLGKLMLNRKNDLNEKKKYIKSIRSILMGDYKKTLIDDLPYLNFESFLSKDFKKDIGEKVFKEWLNNNNIDFILPFAIGNSETGLTKDILQHRIPDDNILNILVRFADDYPDIAKYTYNQGVNQFSGGCISRFIKAMGDLKNLEWDNIFSNTEHIKDVFLEKINEEDLNNNLIKLRKHSKSLTNEISLFCLANDIFLSNSNMTLTFIDYFKGNISSDLFKRIKIKMDDVLDKHKDRLDYNLILKTQWNIDNKKERHIYVLAEKAHISQNLSEGVENTIKRKRM